jgi:glycosyltransferase involved in cell wall biosynthesis
MTPTVSVLMPYRNAASTVVAAAESILAQQGVALELIAADDGSSDGGPGCVAALAEADSRVVPLRVSGRGIVAALQEALARASGRFIARMDADDVALPGRLWSQIEELDRMPRIAALATRVEILSSEPIEGGMSRYVEWQNSLVTPQEHRRDLFIESPVCHASVALRREALDDVGGWREVAWAEDYDLWLRFDAAGWGIAKIPRVLHQWRLHAGQTTFADNRYTRARFFEAKAEYLAPALSRIGRPLSIWGAGPTGRRLARALATRGIFPERFIDIDARKIGRTARRKRIESPDVLERGQTTIVAAVGTYGAREEIRQFLTARGFVEGTDFLCAA